MCARISHELVVQSIDNERNAMFKELKSSHGPMRSCRPVLIVKMADLLQPLRVNDVLVN